MQIPQDVIMLFIVSFFFTACLFLGGYIRSNVMRGFSSIFIIPLICVYYIAFQKTFSEFHKENGIYLISVILPLVFFGILEKFIPKKA